MNAMVSIVIKSLITKTNFSHAFFQLIIKLILFALIYISMNINSLNAKIDINELQSLFICTWNLILSLIWICIKLTDRLIFHSYKLYNNNNNECFYWALIGMETSFLNSFFNLYAFKSELNTMKNTILCMDFSIFISIIFVVILICFLLNEIHLYGVILIEVSIVWILLFAHNIIVTFIKLKHERNARDFMALQ